MHALALHCIDSLACAKAHCIEVGIKCDMDVADIEHVLYFLSGTSCMSFLMSSQLSRHGMEHVMLDVAFNSSSLGN